MTTEIATITDSNKDLIRRTYAPTATPDEFALFCAVCNRYGLDPICKEAWFMKYGSGQAQIFVGRDGMLAIANRSGQFDGLETAPNFDDNGNLVSATCTVWRKDMIHPFSKTVYLKEYSTGQSLWKSKPITMLQKVAETQALRAAFTVSGLYCEEEMGESAQPVKVEPKSTDINVHPEPVRTEVKPCVPPATTGTISSTSAAKPEPQKAPVAHTPNCQTVTVEEVNMRYLPIYQEQKLDISVFSAADLGNGKYDKDMIIADYQRQAGIVKQQKPAPEAHPADGLDKFTAEAVAIAAEDLKRKAEQEKALKNLIVASQKAEASKKTPPAPSSAALSGKTCEACGCKLMNADIAASMKFCDGHLLCEKHRLEYGQKKINAKEGSGS